MDLRFYSLQQLVRYGAGRQDQDMIPYYVHWGLEVAKSQQSAQQTKQAHLHIIDTLTETVCDSVVEPHWRRLCFVHIKRLLPLLHVMLPAKEYTKKVEEIESIGCYFLGKARASYRQN